MEKTINEINSLKFQEQKCLFLFFGVINALKYMNF
jgi:hypothetical protein